MNILDETVKELYELEPYWHICNPCSCKGFCCIGADVSIYEDEWKIIRDYINSLSAKERDIVIDNLTNGRNCIFRTEEKCLIYSVRPKNCRYTPYQYIVTDDNFVKYTQVRLSDVTGRCEFKSIYAAVNPDSACEMRRNKFSDLSNHGKHTKFLSLNWLAAHSESLGEYHYASERMRLELETY